MSTMERAKVGRREVLKGAGLAVVAAVTASEAIAAQAPKRDAPRWAMIMDLRRCVGCSACTVACKAENGVALGRFRTVVQRKMMGTFPDVTKVNLPLMCNHCEGNEKDKIPVCVKVCPQYPGKRRSFKGPDGKKIRYRDGATYKRPDGLILVDNTQCIGCGKCIDECPYGVRSFHPFVKAGMKPELQGVEKCDMCVHRLDNGVEPACVNTCQGKARIFGDLNDPNSKVSQLVKEHNLANNVLLSEEGTYPQVYYIDPNNVLKAAYTKRTKGKLDHFVELVD